jgi:drug/metabolite transporter (DMT)-like permease
MARTPPRCDEGESWTLKAKLIRSKMNVRSNMPIFSKPAFALSDQHRGILLFLLSSSLLAGEVIAVHRIGDAASFLQLSLVRSAGGLVLVALLARKTGWAIFRTKSLAFQFLRGTLTVASMWAIFYGFARAPLADATAIMYTRAIFLTLFAWSILGERLDRRRWAGVLVGILGGILIIRPAFQAWDISYLVVLSASILNAAAVVVTKILGRKDSDLTVLAYVSAISLACSLPGLALPWPLQLTPWLLAISVLGPLAFYVSQVAIRFAEVSVLAPFDYVRLVISAFVAFAVFSEVPNAGSIAGATIITLVTAWIAVSVGRGRRPASGENALKNIPVNEVYRGQINTPELR